MGERREGVLVRVLMRVLVLVLVLVELGAQVGRRAQGGPAVSALRGQEARVQFLSQDVLLWKRRGGAEWHLSLQQSFPSEQDILVPEQGGTRVEAQEQGSRGCSRGLRWRLTLTGPSHSAIRLPSRARLSLRCTDRLQANVPGQLSALWLPAE